MGAGPKLGLSVGHILYMRCWPFSALRLRSVDSASARATELTPAYWSRTVDDLQQQVQSGPAGLSAAQAALRLARDARNSLSTQPRTSALALLFSQFKSPLVVILIVAAIISLVAGEWIDASVVLAIVLLSLIHI